MQLFLSFFPAALLHWYTFSNTTRDLVGGVAFSGILMGGATVSTGSLQLNTASVPLATAQVAYPGNANFYGGWVSNGPNSAWICKSAMTSYQGPAPYGFMRTIDLTGYDASTAYLIGSWGVDDNGAVYINSVLVASSGYSGNGLISLVVRANSNIFSSGRNQLSIWITYGDDYRDAVRLEGTVYAVPLPTATNPNPTAVEVVAIVSTGLDASNNLITQGGQSDGHYKVAMNPTQLSQGVSGVSGVSLPIVNFGTYATSVSVEMWVTTQGGTWPWWSYYDGQPYNNRCYFLKKQLYYVSRFKNVTTQQVESTLSVRASLGWKWRKRH